MKSATFNRIFKKQVEVCESMLVRKADEYATDDDRLHNFQVAGALQGVSPVQALGGFMAKHTVSIYDMIDSSDGQYTMDQWDEKITDHINYLILLKACVHESIWGNTTDQPVLPYIGTQPQI